VGVDRIFLAAAVAALVAVLAGYHFELTSNPAAEAVLEELQAGHPAKQPGRVPHSPTRREWRDFEIRPWSATYFTHVNPRFIEPPPPPPKIELRLAELSIVADARVEGTALTVSLGTPPKHEEAFTGVLIERRIGGGEWRPVTRFEPDRARSFEHFDDTVEPRAVYEYRARGTGKTLAAESGIARAEIPWNFRVVLLGNFKRERDEAIVQVSKYDHAHRAWFGPVEYRVHVGDGIGERDRRDFGGRQVNFDTGLTVVELRGFAGGGRHELVCRSATGESLVFRNKR